MLFFSGSISVAAQFRYFFIPEIFKVYFNFSGESTLPSKRKGRPQECKRSNSFLSMMITSFLGYLFLMVKQALIPAVPRPIMTILATFFLLFKMQGLQ